ncbi:MAG: efflux RND transporter periplasmic adaptor subunit [Acidobacteria bacterium]|nr:efflux RND transporter periplasmic adaptor subunit [Acidobacteriota bacterium]
MVKYWFGVAAASAALIAMLGCSGSKPATVAAAEQSVIPSANASPAPAATPAAEFLATGPVVVENQVDVAAQREGIVVRTLAEPGTRVKKGQLLATLDDRQLTAELDAATAKTRSIQADLKNWESEAKVLDADFQRAQKMWDAGLITKEQYDHAKYKAESDQWDVQRVKELQVNAQQSQRALSLELEKMSIRAPFDGIVARRYVRAGQHVTVGDRIFWVTAESPLRVKFTLPERFLGTINNGQLLRVTSTDSNLQAHTAKVIAISPVVDPSSGTIEVLAELRSPYGQMRPGMTATVHLDNPR